MFTRTVKRLRYNRLGEARRRRRRMPTNFRKGAAATSESRAKWIGSARGRWRSESPGWPPGPGKNRWPRRPCPRPQGCFPAGSGSTGLSTRKSRTISSLIPSSLTCSDSGRTGSGSVPLPFCFRFFPFAPTPLSIPPNARIPCASGVPAPLFSRLFVPSLLRRVAFRFLRDISPFFFEPLLSTALLFEIPSPSFAAFQASPFQLGSFASFRHSFLSLSSLQNSYCAACSLHSENKKAPELFFPGPFF